MRRIALLVTVVGGLVFGFAAPSPAVTGVTCQFSGTATLSPPLTTTPQSFGVTLTGTLSGCRSEQIGVPASGTLSAGEVFTDASGYRYQEQIPRGNGTCSSSSGSVVAIVTWNDGTHTVLSFSTTARQGTWHANGGVIPNTALTALDPASG